MKIIGNLIIKVKNIQILGKVFHLGTRSNPTQTCFTNVQSGVPGHPAHLQVHRPLHPIHHLHPTDASVQYYQAQHLSAVVPAGQEVIIRVRLFMYFQIKIY